MNQLNSRQPRPHLLQFKNALHFGFVTFPGSLDPIHFQKDTLKTNRLSSKDLEFSRNISRMTVSHSNSTLTMKQNIDKIGVTIDDEGKVLIAQWKNGRVQGRYYFFKPNVIGDSRMTNQYEGICQYGSILNGRLEGDNYLYNCNGQIVKSSFSKDVIDQKCFLYQQGQSNEDASSGQKVVCEVIVVPKNDQGQASQQQRDHKLKIPKLQHIQNQSHSQTKKVVQRTYIQSPIAFLESMILDFNREEKQNSIVKFERREMNPRENFIGFFHSISHENKKHNQNCEKSGEFDGFGVIFRDGWPLKYGSFSNGKLDSLGRKYESSSKFQDGFFLNDELIQGFIFDYQNKKIYFGYSSIFQAKEPAQQQFIITDQSDLSQIQRISEYKKSFHLKSLHYTNNYFNPPNIVNRSPWPYKILALVDKVNSKKKVLRSYDAGNQISSVSRQPQSSSNRNERQFVEQMRNRQKQHYIKVGSERASKNAKINSIRLGIENCLKQERVERERQNFERNIYQYHRIQTQRTLSSLKDKRQNLAKDERQKAVFKRELSYYADLPISKEKSQVNASQENQDKPQDLCFLINQYRNCQKQEKRVIQTQRIQNGTTAKKQRSISTAKKSAIKAKKTQRTHSPIKNLPSKQQATTARTNQSTTFSLHQIYKQYLKY